MGTMVRTLVLALVAISCTARRDYVVSGWELQHHIDELRANGEAKVETFELEKDESDQQVWTRLHEVVRMDQHVAVDGKGGKLADLTLHCTDDTSGPPKPESPCALERLRAKFITLRSEGGGFDAGGTVRVVGALAIIGVAVGGTVCTFGCDAPYNYLSAAAVVVSLAAALALCSATPRCHD